MRDEEISDFNPFVNCIPFPAGKKAAALGHHVLSKRVTGKNSMEGCSSVYRDMKLLAIGSEAAYMVKMVMGDHDRTDILRRQAHRKEAS
jgi:hypothetical protein